MKIKSISKTLAVVTGLFLSNQSLVVAQDSQSASPATTTTDSIFTKERWSASYLNYMNGPTFSESSGGSINHYLTLKHKFNADWGLSAVFRPDSNFGNDESFFTLGDSYLRLQYPTIYKNDKGIKITGDARYYAPMSKSSRAANHAGVISTRLMGNAVVGDLTFDYILIPKVFLNTQSKDGQKTFSHGHWFGASYKVFSKLKVDFALYPEWVFKQNTETAFNDLLAYPGVTIDFTDKLSLSPYVEIPLMNAEAKAISVGGVLSYTVL